MMELLTGAEERRGPMKIQVRVALPKTPRWTPTGRSVRRLRITHILFGWALVRGLSLQTHVITDIYALTYERGVETTRGNRTAWWVRATPPDPRREPTFPGAAENREPAFQRHG